MPRNENPQTEQMCTDDLELIGIACQGLRGALELYESAEQIVVENHSVATAVRTVYAIENDILAHT